MLFLESCPQAQLQRQSPLVTLKMSPRHTSVTYMCKFDNPGLSTFLEFCMQSDADADANAASISQHTKVNLYVTPIGGGGEETL